MKVTNIIRKQTLVIAIAVVLVAVTISGVSYAIFFDVKKSDKTQTITAGDITLTVTNSDALTLSEPVSEDDGLATTGFTYTVKNTASYATKYSICAYADSSNALSLSKIKVSTDGTNASTLTSLTPLTVNTSSGDTTGSTSCYTLASSTLAAAASASGTIRVWIDEDTVEDSDNGLAVALNLFIINEVS